MSLDSPLVAHSMHFLAYSMQLVCTGPDTWLMNTNGCVVLDLSRGTKGDVILQKKLVVYLYSLTLGLEFCVPAENSIHCLKVATQILH